MTITLLTTADKQEWQEALPINKNVFGGVEYAGIHETFSPKLEARLFVWSSGGQEVVYPFFLQSLNSLPFESNVIGWDITTPEYTGPIWRMGSKVDEETQFIDDFNEFCQAYGIVAEFAHLNPWEPKDGIVTSSSITVDREIVFVDLELPEEKLWSDSFTYACRKNIRRAQKEDVQVFSATTLKHVQDFYQIYVQTMTRNEAQKKYYYPFEFFQAFFERMSGNAKFIMAAYRDQIVAGTLYLHDDENVFSYLGGADHAFQHVRPTNLIVFEAINWAKKMGKKRLVLGGGYRKDDGIFRFKSSFSPCRVPFEVSRRVHLLDKYEILCRAWSEHYQAELNSTQYFPIYRAVL